MKINEISPPRSFSVGIGGKIIISEVGRINLGNNEQITFINDKDKEYDIVSKDWGYYATPSINGRLKKNDFKTALVVNQNKKYYIMIVERLKIQIFEKYLNDEKQSLVEWLDER